MIFTMPMGDLYVMRKLRSGMYSGEIQRARDGSVALVAVDKYSVVREDYECRRQAQEDVVHLMYCHRARRTR